MDEKKKELRTRGGFFTVSMQRKEFLLVIPSVQQSLRGGPLCLLLCLEEESHLTIGQLAVHKRESRELVLDLLLILRVQEDLEVLGTIRREVDPLSIDRSRVNDVIQDRIVDSGQSPAAREDLARVSAEILCVCCVWCTARDNKK